MGLSSATARCSKVSPATKANTERTTGIEAPPNNAIGKINTPAATPAQRPSFFTLASIICGFLEPWMGHNDFIRYFRQIREAFVKTAAHPPPRPDFTSLTCLS